MSEVTKHRINLTEWNINDALHAFFTHDRDFFFIYQDPDLLLYMDRMLIPVMKARTGRKAIQKRELTTCQGKAFIVNTGTFRPDAVLVSKSGKPYILETKVKSIKTAYAANDLIIQTLFYAGALISFSHSLSEGLTDPLARYTHDFLDNLYEAHWHLKVHGQENYWGLAISHQKRFNLPEPLEPKNFSQIPSVILLLEDYNIEQIRQACSKVWKMDFQEYREYIKSNFSTIYKGENSSGKLSILEKNWKLLQSVEFCILKLEKEKLESAISDEITLVA